MVAPLRCKNSLEYPKFLNLNHEEFESSLSGSHILLHIASVLKGNL